MESSKVRKEDYIFCETCGMYVDFWKYGHNLKDSDHDGCVVREITEAEFDGCFVSCADAGCFDEEESGMQKIIVILKDGFIQDVENIPDGVDVEVRDYDVHDCLDDEIEHLSIDGNGTRYARTVYSGGD